MSTDTFVDLSATTLTNTTMATGTQTLLTAAAGTSYVFKDWFAEQNDLVTNLTLSINDIDVGINALKVAGGSLIIPPAGTLKVLSTSYPLTYTSVDADFFKVSTNYPNYQNQRFIGLESVSTDTSGGGQYQASVPSSMDTNTTAKTNEFQQIGVSFYQNLKDYSGNARATYYWATGSSGRTTLDTAIGHATELTPTGICWIDGSNTLKTHTPAGGAVTVRTSVPNTTFVTYSRSAYMNGWLFWTETNSNTTLVRAISVTTGAAYNFTSMATMSSLGSHWRLLVAYDDATDKFYIYRLDSGNAYAYQAIPDVTVTTMNAASDDSDNSITAYTESTLSTYGTVNPLIDTYNTYYNNVKGSNSDGNVFYYITNLTPWQDIYQYDWSAEVVSLAYSTTYDGAGYSYYYRVWAPTAAEITADNYESSPNISVRASGIKSVE